MAAVIHAFSSIADVFARLLAEIANGAAYLLVLNYELVSFLLRVLAYAFNGIRIMFLGLYYAIYDFGDQYSDFCVTVLRSLFQLATLLGQCLVLVGHAICKVLLAAMDTVFIIIQCPIFLWQGLTATVGLLQSIPANLIDSMVEGFAMLGMVVVDGTGAVVNLFSNVVTSAVNTTISVATKKKIDGELLDTEAVASTRLVSAEVGIGLGICALSYVAFKNRRRIWRMLRSKLITFSRYLYFVWRKIQSAVIQLLNPIIGCFRRRPRQAGPQPNPSTLSRLLRLPLNPNSNATGNSSKPPDVTNPSTSGTASNSDPDRYLCVVCQDEERSVMVQNCRHVCMCPECAETVFHGQRRCPICRGFIISLTDVYL